MPLEVPNCVGSAARERLDVIFPVVGAGAGLFALWRPPICVLDDRRITCPGQSVLRPSRIATGGERLRRVTVADGHSGDMALSADRGCGQMPHGLSKRRLFPSNAPDGLNIL